MIWKRLLTSIIPIHKAESAAEIEAIQRFRYTIYVDEQGDQNHQDVDHEKRLMGSEEDEAPNTLLFYAGTPEKITATVRFRLWEPGEFPEDKVKFYSIDRLPDVSDFQLMEGNYLMAKRSKRGTGTMVALCCNALETVGLEHGVDLMLFDCVPGLVRAYARLGARPYGGRPIPTDVGFLIPLLGIANDLEYLRRVKSPWYSVLKSLKKRGRLTTKDLSAFKQAVEGYQGIEVDPLAIMEEVDECFENGSSSLLSTFLPDEILDKISESGFVIEMEPGAEVVREGALDQDVYIVLDGALEVRRNSRYVATMTQGSVFGKMTLFRTSPERSASVVVTTPCRLLVLRKSVLDKWEKSAPERAMMIYKALAAILVTRVEENWTGC